MIRISLADVLEKTVTASGPNGESSPATVSRSLSDFMVYVSSRPDQIVEAVVSFAAIFAAAAAGESITIAGVDGNDIVLNVKDDDSGN